jgi:methylated-DNA-protein-cysteine methyltransferase-like protein
VASEFQEQVFAIVAGIPEGKVVTYGQIAAWLGQPRAARQVGYAMAACPRERKLPWHRVVNARGEVSKRANPGDEAQQRTLLESEGVAFDEHGRLSLDQYRWDPTA